MADPDVRVVYEKRAAKEHRVPYRVAISDYFKGKDLLAKKSVDHLPKARVGTNK